MYLKKISLQIFFQQCESLQEFRWFKCLCSLCSKYYRWSNFLAEQNTHPFERWSVGSWYLAYGFDVEWKGFHPTRLAKAVIYMVLRLSVFDKYVSMFAIITPHWSNSSLPSHLENDKWTINYSFSYSFIKFDLSHYFQTNGSDCVWWLAIAVSVR